MGLVTEGRRDDAGVLARLEAALPVPFKESKYLLAGPEVEAEVHRLGQLLLDVDFSLKAWLGFGHEVIVGE